MVVISLTDMNILRDFLQTNPFTTRPLAASDTSSVTLKSTDLLSPPPPSPIQNRQSTLATPSIRESDANPWLTHISEPTVKLTKKTNEVVVQKESKALDKSKNKLKKQARKGEDVRELAKEDGVVEISLDKVLNFPSAPPNSNPSEPVRKADQKANQQAPVVQADDESDSNSEVGAQETAQTLKGKRNASGIKAFEQRDLIAVAFAGDNVVQVRFFFVVLAVLQ
jgi:U3 small nucleolar RNA-associated protein 14